MPRGKKKDVEQPKEPELLKTVESKPIRKTKARTLPEPEVREIEPIDEVKVPEKKARKLVIKKARPSEVKPVINENSTKPEPTPTKVRARKSEISEEPVVVPKTRAKTDSKPKVEVVTKSVQRKPITKKPRPVIVKPVKPAPVKKLTKKQIEKQIEQEKVDNSVPQVVPKKTIDFMVESTTKVKRSEDKYVSLAENAKQEERKLMTEKLQKNEVVFSHYAIDNDIAYHYYRVLTK